MNRIEIKGIIPPIITPIPNQTVFLFHAEIAALDRNNCTALIDV